MTNGFLLKHCHFEVGSADFPNTTTYEAITLKEQKIVKSVVELLLNSGLGWELDYTRNLTTDDFCDCPNKGKLGAGSTVANYKSPCLFLKNTVSGCKLFISYLCSCSYGGFAIYDSENNLVFDDNMVINFHNNGGNYTMRTCGLLMSIIPPSEENFGQNFDSNFLPPHATRIIGSMNQEYSSSPSTSTSQYVCFPNSRSSYSLDVYLWIKSDCIGFGYKHNNNLIPRYFIGNIFSYLANSADNHFYSSYGVIVNLNSYYQDYNGDPCNELKYTSFNYNSSTAAAGGSINVFGNGLNNLKTYSGGASPLGSNSCFTSSGVYLNGNARVYSVACYSFQELLKGSYLFKQSGNQIAWFPIAMFVCTNDLENYGVTETNGFKGFLNTDLFRSTNSTATNGTVLDDNFVVYNYGLAICGVEE